MQKKRVIKREVSLAYPDFNTLFVTHTDASKLQIGAVILHSYKCQTFFVSLRPACLPVSQTCLSCTRSARARKPHSHRFLPCAAREKGGISGPRSSVILYYDTR